MGHDSQSLPFTFSCQIQIVTWIFVPWMQNALCGPFDVFLWRFNLQHNGAMSGFPGVIHTRAHVDTGAEVHAPAYCRYSICCPCDCKCNICLLLVKWTWINSLDNRKQKTGGSLNNKESLHSAVEVYDDVFELIRVDVKPKVIWGRGGALLRHLDLFIILVW